MNNGTSRIPLQASLIARNVTGAVLRLVCAGAFAFMFISPFVFRTLTGIPPPILPAAMHVYAMLPYLVAFAFCGFLLYQCLHFKRHFVEVDATGLTVRTGVAFATSVRVPLSRITHATIERDLLDVLFGLCKVQIGQTTGELGLSARIDGLTSSSAGDLLRLLLPPSGVLSWPRLDDGREDVSVPLPSRSSVCVAEQSVKSICMFAVLLLALGLFVSPFAFRVLACLPDSATKALHLRWTVLASVLGTVVLLIPGYHWLRFRRDGILFGKGRITITRGLLIRRQAVLSLTSVVDVFIERNALDVVFGLWRVALRVSSGGGDSIITFDGFRRRAGTALRQVVLIQAGKEQSSSYDQDQQRRKTVTPLNTDE